MSGLQRAPPGGPRVPRTVTRPAAAAPVPPSHPALSWGQSCRAGEVLVDTRGPREGEITQVPGAEAQPRGHLQRRPSEAPGAICMRYPHVLREHDLETRVHRREPMCVHIMVPWAPAVLPEEPCSAPGGAPTVLLEEPCSAPGGAPTVLLEEPCSAPGGAPALPLEEPPLCSWRSAAFPGGTSRELTGLWPWRCHSGRKQRRRTADRAGQGAKQGSAAPSACAPPPSRAQHSGFLTILPTVPFALKSGFCYYKQTVTKDP